MDQVLRSQPELRLDRFAHDPLVLLGAAAQLVGKLDGSARRTHRLVVPVELAAVDVRAALEVRLCRSRCAQGPRSQHRVCEGPKHAPASIEMTLSRTFSTLCTGLQRSDAASYIVGSSPGVCRIEMHTVPSA